MIIRLNITDEILKIIPTLFIQTEGDNFVGIDREWLFGGSHVLEDIALAIGKSDEAIDGTDEDPEGRAFPEELEKHMLELHDYIKKNLFYLESLIHQFAVKGGLTEGVYVAKDNMLIWTKES